MLKKVWQLTTYLEPAASDVSEAEEDKRFATRFPFDGVAFAARVGKNNTTLRLKDLSCGGAAGLLDEPVAVGDILYVEFDEKHIAEAEVRWVRRIMVGVKFSRLLDPIYVQRVHAEFSNRLQQDEADGSGADAAA